MKSNTDGAPHGAPGPSACADIFRNNFGHNLGCFALNIGVSNALYAEVMGVILAIECAYDKNWQYLWIECDSKLVTLAFMSAHIIPWQMKNRWENCMTKLKSMNFFITHIYRHGNHCEDKLAS